MRGFFAYPTLERGCWQLGYLPVTLAGSAEKQVFWCVPFVIQVSQQRIQPPGSADRAITGPAVGRCAGPLLDQQSSSKDVWRSGVFIRGWPGSYCLQDHWNLGLGTRPLTDLGVFWIPCLCLFPHHHRPPYLMRPVIYNWI